MEPATMSDVKDLLKELRDSIKKAFAVEFGNWKPALEHATTSTASLFLVTNASDTKVPPPACSSPDQGTSALYLAPTATIDILPELDIDATDVAAPTPTSCLIDGLNYNADGDVHMVAWQAAWSMPTYFTVPSGDSPIPSSEPSLGLALGALEQAKCSTEGSETSANSIVLASMSGVARSATVTMLYTTASALCHWLQRVPPWPPDPWKFFWGKHGFLLSGRSDLEAQMRTSPNQSLCTVLRQSQDYNADSFFTVVHLCRYRLLTEGLCGLITARSSLCATLKTAVMLFLHTTSSCDGKYLLIHAAFRSFWFVSFPIGEPWSYWQGECYNKLPSCGDPNVYQLLSCKDFSETTLATTKSEGILGSQLQFLLRGAAPIFLMEIFPECIDGQLADLLEEKLNETPKCSVTKSCESGYKMHHTSFLIWRTSAVCVLLCCYTQFQWKLAGFFYHQSNCCPVTLLRLPLSANCLTLMYAAHKNQICYMKLSHSSQCQEGTNLTVEQIWCAITSNTLGAYLRVGDDHACESLFNLERGGVAFTSSFLHGKDRYICSTCAVAPTMQFLTAVWFACVLPMSTEVRIDTSERIGEQIKPMSKDFSCMCFLRDAYIQVQTFYWYVSQQVQFRASELDCSIGKSRKMLELLPESILQKLQHVGGDKKCGLHTSWNPGDLTCVVVGYWITAYEQVHFQGGRDVIALAILIDQVYGVLYTSLGVQNLPELNRRLNITVWILPFYAATKTFETRSSWLQELFQCSGQGDIFYEISLPPCFLLPLVLELPLWWDPGGEEFFAYFMQTEAKGGRNNKSAAYCVDQFSCFDLTCSFKQVPVDHKFYSDFDQVRAGNDDQLRDAASFTLAQVYFNNGYHISTKECRVSWDPGDKESAPASAWGQAEFQGGRGVSNSPRLGLGLALEGWAQHLGHGD